MDILRITDIKDVLIYIDIFVKIIIVFGGIWALYKVKKYRELKQRLQFDFDTNIYKLSDMEKAKSFQWTKEGERIETEEKDHTHVVEILLKFTNKGLIRMRLFNIQIGINTMRKKDGVKFNKSDGHLHLTRIFTSGNIVPIFKVPKSYKLTEDTFNRLAEQLDDDTEESNNSHKILAKIKNLKGKKFVNKNNSFVTVLQKKLGSQCSAKYIKLILKYAKKEYHPIEETSFYYIEPGVEQTITYLALITNPRELIQVYTEFSLEQKRIFPEERIGKKGVYPHTAARTFQINTNEISISRGKHAPDYQ